MSYWQGEKITLRAIEPSDAQTIFDWHQDSELSRTMGFLEPPQSMASLEAYTGEMSLRKMDAGDFFWMIENKDHDVVGYIDTRCDVRHGNFEYGVSISPLHQRSGYAAEAIMLIVDYYFQHLRYHKVTPQVNSDNVPSIRLHESLGFKLEGTVREMMFSNGVYLDVLYYGLTFDEYTSHKLASRPDEDSGH
jgi:RimJ/RimL family protein N-acetyltransferase